MYSNMCVKVALCIAVVACVSGHIVRPKEVPLPPEGLTIELTVKSRDPKAHPVYSMKIDIDGHHKKVILPGFEERMPIHTTHPPKEELPTIGTRNGIRVGTCPAGFTMYGGFCFKDDDDLY